MTTQMILMVVILLAVTYMFFSPRFPNAVVATIGAVAVGLIGTVQFKSIFTYYAGTSIVLMVGMMIVGGGMFHTGFAGWMGNSIVKLTGKGEPASRSLPSSPAASCPRCAAARPR